MSSDSVEVEAFDFIDEVNLAVTRGEIVQRLGDHLGRYGFTDFLITHMPPPQFDLESHVILSGWSQEWYEYYITKKLYRVDPMAKYTRETVDPFFWDEVPRESDEDPASELVMNQASEHGLKEGFSVPIYSSSGEQTCITMGGGNLDIPPRGRNAIHLVSIYSCHRAQQLGSPFSGSFASRKTYVLSGRERECLRWVARGKTDWEVGEILKISEHTANAHVRRAMHKLDAYTRTQAVVLALSNGEIAI